MFESTHPIICKVTICTAAAIKSAVDTASKYTGYTASEGLGESAMMPLQSCSLSISSKPAIANESDMNITEPSVDDRSCRPVLRLLEPATRQHMRQTGDY
jgi:hypothetical protein